MVVGEVIEGNYTFLAESVTTINKNPGLFGFKRRISLRTFLALHFNVKL